MACLFCLNLEIEPNHSRGCILSLLSLAASCSSPWFCGQEAYTYNQLEEAGLGGRGRERVRSGFGAQDVGLLLRSGERACACCNDTHTD